MPTLTNADHELDKIKFEAYILTQLTQSEGYEMNLGKDCRFLAAVSIDPEAETRDDELFRAIVLAFGNYAGPPDGELPPGPMTVMLFRQDRTVRSYNMRDARVFALDTEMLEKMIHVYENGGSGVITEDTKGLVLLFGLGDNEFCQAFVHFVSTMREGLAENWGLHYLRRIAGLKFGDTLWYDSNKPDDYFFDDLSKIIKHFEESFAT